LTGPAPARAGERGFTLIEVLVAFVIVALALGALLQVFATGLRGSSAAENYTMAALLAESKLAAMGIEEPLEEGERAGEFDNGFAWSTIVRPYDGGGDGGPTLAPGALQAFEVSVTVRWGGAGRERSVSLATLRLVAEP
jgi:general secretion pathway protein I